MGQFDDFEDPCGTPSSARQPSFWASVHWRLGVGIVICALTGIVVFFFSLFHARHPLDIPLMTGGSAVGIATLWVGSRLLWAWVEWPCESPVVRGLKAAVRFLCFDVESERQAAGERQEPPRSDC
jgi:hypothetical protein